MGGYAWSKTPLKLIFGLIAMVLVNLFIIEGFKLMLYFDYEAPIDTATLARMNPEYEGATILDTFVDDKKTILWDSDHTAYLLDTESGRKMAVVEKHFALDRYRYCEQFSCDIPILEGHQSALTGKHYQQALTWVVDSSEFESFVVGQYFGPSIALLLVPMIILEFVAYCFLFKRHEL